MSYSVSGITKASFLGILLVVNFLGNILVARILIKHRRVLLKNRPTYQFILNIIFSDLVIGLLTIPFELVRELVGAWIFGTVSCKIIEFIEIAVSGTAVFTHALIAADRYRSLAHPHLPKLKGKLVKQMIALSWIVPAVMSSPYLYMVEVQEFDLKDICTPMALPFEWLDKLYESAEFAVVLLIPFCVLCWCYFHVTLIMWGRSSRVSVALNTSTQFAISRSRKRVTRTACLISGTFIVCWLPTFILSIVRIASGTDAIHGEHALYEIAMFGGFVNEAINPFIYCVFDRNIKMRVRFPGTHNNGLDSIDHGDLTHQTMECQQQGRNEGTKRCSLLDQTTGNL